MSRSSTAPLLAVLGLVWLAEAEAAPVRVLLQELPVAQRGVIGTPLTAISIETFEEVKLKGKKADAETPSSTVKPVTDGTKLTVISFRNLGGRIAKIEGERISIDIGATKGVEKGMEFAVYHEGAWVGLIRAEEAAASGAVCVPVAGRRTGEGAAASWSFAPGDEVRQREDALGAGLADEAAARGRILGWQREQEGFERERRGFEERERRIMLGLRTSPGISESQRQLKDLTALGVEIRAWHQRYSTWADKVLQDQEARLAGNLHLAAYRQSLAEGTAIDAEEALWQQVRIGLIRGWLDRIEQINAIVKSAPRGKKAVDTAKASIEDTVDQLDLNNFALEELQEDLERWAAQDRVYLARRDAQRNRRVDGLANNARVALLQGLDLRAARLYRQALALEPGGPALRATRAGLELARLRLVLKGEADVEPAGFAPPLSVAWASVDAGELRGEMESDGDLIFAFFADSADPERSVARALHRGTGKQVWEAPFPGRPGGRALAAAGELIVASDRGVLHRFRAADGELLAEFDLGVSFGKVASTLHRVGSRLTWLATVELSGAAGRDLLASIDVEQPSSSRLDTMQGRFIETQPAAGRVLFFAGTARPGETEREQAEEAGLALLLPLPNGGISWPGPQPGKPQTAVLGGLRATDGRARLWAIPGTNVQWLGWGAEHLIASVVSVPEKKDVDPVSHILFFGIAALRGINWRISLPNRAPVADMALAADRAYLLLRDAWLIAVDLKKREVLWTVDLPAASTGGLSWARFLAVGADDLVFWCGGVDPPWTVYSVSTEGFVNSETQVTRGLRALPLWREGHLYSAERDGSVVARHPARDGQVWRFSAVTDEDFFGPQPPEDVAKRIAGDSVGLPGDERQRRLWQTAFVTGRADNRQPLAFAGDRLIFWSSRDRRLYALVPESGRQ